MKLRERDIWFSLFALATLGYTYVQDSLRPSYQGDNLYLIYLLGIAPNFLPRLGVPAALSMLLPEMFGRSGFWTLHKGTLSLGISMVGLIGWEFFQRYTPRGTFDWNDILWTLLGGLCFWLLYRLLARFYWGNGEPQTV